MRRMPTTVIIALLCVSMFTILVRAQPPTQNGTAGPQNIIPPAGVFPIPNTTTPEVGDTFHVNITACNFANLWAWQAGLQWDPTLLQVVSFAWGNFAASIGAGATTIQLAPVIDVTNNVMTRPALESAFAPETSLSTSNALPAVTLLSVTFKAIATGSTKINVTDIELRTQDPTITMKYTRWCDVDNNRKVDSVDVSKTANSWNARGVPYNSICDFNNDQVVDITDIAIVTSDFGKQDGLNVTNTIYSLLTLPFYSCSVSVKGGWNPYIITSIMFSANCPVYLDLYDGQGNCVGYNQTSGEVDSQIDNVFWESNQTLLVLDPSGTYTIEATGTDNGTYELVTSWQDATGNTGIISDVNSTITENETQDYTVGAVPDMALTSILSTKTVECQGFGLQVNATVADLSGVDATCDVSLYANGTVIGTLNALNVSEWNSATACFACNTTGLAYGNYTLSAYAWPVPGETNTADNNCTGGWIVVSIPGDLTGGTPNPWEFVPDGKVDGKDITIVALCFGSAPGCSPPYVWNANSDVNNDAKIDGADIATVALHYGQASP